MTEATPVSLASDDDATPPKRWRRELLLAAICVAIGFLVLPALIYAVGMPVLGSYGGGEHVGAFYVNFVRNLLAGTGRTWFIMLAPYLLFIALRLIFWPWGNKLPINHPGQPAPSKTSPQARAPKERREPFVAQ